MGRPGRAIELSTGPHLAAGGEAVATAADGRKVFVAGAAPQERLRARVTQDNKRFLRAEALSVIEPGPARVNPACVHYGRCGGCSLQHVAAEAQTESKDLALTQTLQRVGRVRAERRPAAWSGLAYGYRARLRLAWSVEGALGLRAARSRAVVPLTACPVLAPELERAALSLCQRLAGRRPRRALELRLLTNGARVQLSAPAGAPPIEPLPGVELEPAEGPPGRRGIDAADGLGPLWQSAGLFAQANRAGNAAILADLDAHLAALSPGSAFELYAGAGNLTRRLVAAQIPQITATELNPQATTFLKAALGEAVEVWAESDRAALARLPRGGVDLALVDPPRAGLPEALSAALADKSGALLYLSCNPASFARDAGRLAQHGLQLRWARLYDLYPQTAHQELLGLFGRA